MKGRWACAALTLIKDQLVKPILSGAEWELKADDNSLDRKEWCFPNEEEHKTIPEGDMMHSQVDEEMEEPHGNWSEREIPIDKREEILAEVPQEVRRSVRRAYRRLGHPSKSTFMRMM